MLVLSLQEVPQYELPIATPTTLGGVMIPADSGLEIDSAGNLRVIGTQGQPAGTIEGVNVHIVGTPEILPTSSGSVGTPAIGTLTVDSLITANSGILINGFESNASVLTGNYGGDPITLSIEDGLNCFFINLIQDVQSLTVVLPQNPRLGTSVEFVVKGNAASLNVSNPPEGTWAPVLGAPTSVEGYAALKFRYGTTNIGGGDVSMGYFRVA
jgi:hypothetical protein